jgi:surface polysaccharide O-acyltransferase-like enzyme
MGFIFSSLNGRIAVPTFAIITGYFSATNKQIKIFNIINTLIIYLLFVMIVQICITGNFDIIGDINNYQWYG